VSQKPLRIGTRGSSLALAQANEIVRALQTAHGPSFKTELVVLKTTGDQFLNAPLASIGGKGVFVKEIEKALLDGVVDVAVHSLKDLPSVIPDGLLLAAVPRREDPHDCLISRFGEQLEELPRGAVVGTSSLRRQAQVRAVRRVAKVQPLRGNLDTRLKRLQDGDFDAIVVAVAGVRRLGRSSEISQIIPYELMLPCPGQGCLALEVREGDDLVKSQLVPLNDLNSYLCALAERAMMSALGGDCYVPVAGLAQILAGSLKIQALIMDPSGKKSVRDQENCSLALEALDSLKPESLLRAAAQVQLAGSKLGGKLLASGGSELLIEIANGQEAGAPDS